MIQIDKFTVGSKRCFVIAEIGNNHNGDYDLAVEMINLAVSMGADCVKFQMRNLENLYRKKSLLKAGDDLGTEYILDLLHRFELPIEMHKKLFDYCKQKEILYLCTPWDDKSLTILENFGVQAYKVASADLTNLPLIKKICDTKKPLILSTGMSTIEEIKNTIHFLNSQKAQYVLLHCNSTYPAPLQDINLKWMLDLKKLHPLVGYSGHERGTTISIAAVALGACVIERHFTLDRMMEGPDHAASLEFSEFKFLVEGIRDVELGLGDGVTRRVSQGEMINRENLSKSLVAKRALKEGEIVTEGDIDIKGPGQGLSPQKYYQLIGRKLHRNIEEEGFFYPSDLGSNTIKPREYKFTRPWGVPVRYHDFLKYKSISNPDLFEFHLSYSDMNLDPSSFLIGMPKVDFIVHAPELFENSHLMDLTSDDENYRRISVNETQKVINITRELKRFFPKTERPMIVANIGGFSMDMPISDLDKDRLSKNFAKSISELDCEGIELIPQTMAPFPWHFGGQRYQNLLIKPEDIINWCNLFNLRICLDLSHSMLACNHFKINFEDFVRRVAPYIAHIHVGDAAGVNGEGLQIGDGEINFENIFSILDRDCPNSPFIPEIWQGHKNDGEGFWIAMDKLEKFQRKG